LFQKYVTRTTNVSAAAVAIFRVVRARIHVSGHYVIKLPSQNQIAFVDLFNKLYVSN